MEGPKNKRKKHLPLKEAPPKKGEKQTLTLNEGSKRNKRRDTFPSLKQASV
jgi:hypothetical protein